MGNASENQLNALDLLIEQHDEVDLLMKRLEEEELEGQDKTSVFFELADKLAKEAKEDFAAAAKQADVGLDNAGEMRRGVLEPGPEYTLFNLAVGDVGGPVDSPRGFYVFKRIE